MSKLWRVHSTPIAWKRVSYGNYRDILVGRAGRCFLRGYYSLSEIQTKERKFHHIFRQIDSIIALRIHPPPPLQQQEPPFSILDPTPQLWSDHIHANTGVLFDPSQVKSHFHLFELFAEDCWEGKSDALDTPRDTSWSFFFVFFKQAPEKTRS